MHAKWLFSLLFSFTAILPALADDTVDLLQRYPTELTKGDASVEHARAWEFGKKDVFRLSRFRLEAGNGVRIEIGTADLGIGHCSDGAVWAVVIPRDGGNLTSQVVSNNEPIAHIWLRFHPAEINRLFPADTVFSDGAKSLAAQMRGIAGVKFYSSWHAGDKAMIPEPKDLTVDIDTMGGARRFFVVDTAANKAEYAAAFERRPVKTPPKITPALAAEAFDNLWQAYDRDYALFILRPEVDWSKLRDEYRPRALAAASTYEFADIFAEMLKPLRDLHIWMSVAGANLPIFSRPRASNANPSAHARILGELNQSRDPSWTVTENRIGYIAIYGWNQQDLPNRCHEVLEKMRETRGLIVDVRLNGGGSENLAMEFAGRFLSSPFVYGFSQYRNGPAHTNLTEKIPRSVSPKGPWRYNRPVVLLIGQKCMSSNESFIGMMSGDPDLVTMGDHTCGSSGNPRMLNLPLGITVSLPQWIDYLPDGTPLDERGFQPQITFKSKPGAFEDDRDDLLTAALERLRKAPLPEKAIEGPAFSSVEASR